MVYSDPRLGNMVECIVLFSDLRATVLGENGKSTENTRVGQEGWVLVPVQLVTLYPRGVKYLLVNFLISKIKR